MRIDNSPIMLADEFPDMGYRSPRSLGGSPVSILLYVADIDAQFARVIAAGATETMPVADRFDGDSPGNTDRPIWTRLAARNQEGEHFTGRNATTLRDDDEAGRMALSPSANPSAYCDAMDSDVASISNAASTKVRVAPILDDDMARISRIYQAQR
jgi:hypothetical protein